MEQRDQPGNLAAFPAPPPFYKNFTRANRAQATALQAKDGASIPPELRTLLPPAPPETGTYRCFGDPYHIDDVLPSLSDSNIEQLYPATPAPDQPDSSSQAATPARNKDRAFYLQKITQSLLLNFMELVGILSTNPAQYEEKIHDLRTLFVNAHHLLNEYRPHQARESLALLMEEQLDRCRAETETIRQMKAKVERVLEGVSDEMEKMETTSTAALADVTKAEATARLGVERRVWALLDQELG
ncbi:MAG: Mediator of RNA polymerase II transcription subunit 7 [Thelocarpon superellum]|nr:MAG: Mediator of RNA polymerase II transcription subunit 7 [Thelocarpon superellum]